MNICLFEKEELTKPLKYHDERAQHLIKILHKKAGDSFRAGIINGKEGKCVITKIISKNEQNAGDIYFIFTPEKDGKKLYPVNFIIGFPRPIQLKRLFRDIAGLGISNIYLTGTELGEKSYLKSNIIKDGSAHKMLVEGIVQATGTYIPELSVFETLEKCLNRIQLEDSILIAPDNINPVCSITKFLKQNFSDNQQKNFRNVFIAIGSERGWTYKEREMLESKGFIRCSMGTRVLRTETAATVAGSLVLSSMGII